MAILLDSRKQFVCHRSVFLCAYVCVCVCAFICRLTPLSVLHVSGEMCLSPSGPMWMVYGFWLFIKIMGHTETINLFGDHICKHGRVGRM